MQRPKRTRKILTDKEKYAAYVAMHMICMDRGGKFKRDDKKKHVDFCKQTFKPYKEFGKLL